MKTKPCLSFLCLLIGLVCELPAQESSPPVELEQKAQSGDADAQYEIGELLAMSQEDGDLQKGVAWLQKSAAQNHAKALSMLGWIYLEGFGVEEDDSKGIELLKRAIEQGNGNAAMNIGWHFRQSRNFDSAIKWYQKSDEMGDRCGCYYLGEMHEFGLGTEQNLATAKKQYEKLVDRGDALGWTG